MGKLSQEGKHRSIAFSNANCDLPFSWPQQARCTKETLPLGHYSSVHRAVALKRLTDSGFTHNRVCRGLGRRFLRSAACHPLENVRTALAMGPSTRSPYNELTARIGDCSKYKMMTRSTHLSPLNQTQVLDRYFLEHRAKLIDIAAFLDRVDRACHMNDSGATQRDDFRLTEFRAAVKMLVDAQPQRAKRILEALSDPTATPTTTAQCQGAVGAPRPTTAVEPCDGFHDGSTT